MVLRTRDYLSIVNVGVLRHFSRVEAKLIYLYNLYSKMCLLSVSTKLARYRYFWGGKCPVSPPTPGDGRDSKVHSVHSNELQLSFIYQVFHFFFFVHFIFSLLLYSRNKSKLYTSACSSISIF